MINPRTVSTLLLLSAASTLGTVWFLREAEAFVSKHFGIEEPVTYSYFSQLGAWFFWFAVAFWSIGIAATFRLVPEQQRFFQLIAAILPLVGVLIFLVAIFFFPIRHV